jgi:hypothetical protein
MNRPGFRKVLVERGLYGEGRSARAVDTLLEVQYTMTKSLVTKILKAGRPLSFELITDSFEQTLGKRHLPAGDRDAFSSINSQQLPEVKVINGPAAGDMLRYDIPRATEVTVPQTRAPTVSSSAQSLDEEEGAYPARKAPNQVLFQTKDGQEGAEEEDFTKKFLQDSDDEEDAVDDGYGGQKRLRLE